MTPTEALREIYLLLPEYCREEDCAKTQLCDAGEWESACVLRDILNVLREAGLRL